MNKTILILPSFVLLIAIFSCGRNYHLNEGDLEYIPYEGNEILVFESDHGRLDTIFIEGLRNFTGCVDPLAISPNECEGKTLVCTRTDPNYDRYLDGGGMMELQATSSGTSHISFDIMMKGSRFYGLESHSVSSFDSIAVQELTIGDRTYEDVKVFEAGAYAKHFEHRDNYVERFYWSRSLGFLGLDRREEKWRLIKRYIP